MTMSFGQVSEQMASKFAYLPSHEHAYQYCGIHIGYKDHVVLCCGCGDVKFVPTPVKEGELCLNR